MSKYEFLLRISMLGQGKLAILKKISQLFESGLPNKINNLPFLLEKLALSEAQQANFLATSYLHFEPILEWLDTSYPKKDLIAYCDLDYPVLLKQISSPPLFLFVMGNQKLLHSPQIAMVGSREFSEYGAQWGRYFAGELAINGLTVTSGLALGLDAICHRGALEVSGHTIAVLGSGLAQIAPRSNLNLANDMLAQDGAIVSEFLPFEKARAEYFPRRNRIISGLSLGTFVVEASEKSGSLITARYALEQNRDVFALPGDIDNQNCSGTHYLIKQGAYLVTEPIDILEHYSRYLSTIHRQEHNHDEHDNSILYPEIFSVIHHQPIAVDTIAALVDLTIPELTSKLLDMEIAGLIMTVTGGYIRKRTIK
ncbi:DNA-processing protein DprA [Gilliamella sp. B2840]|uniref:DNA-processing protein DprA n=1 Tax=unclassified Gilliamella TaxID=2685620 RepID=UPI00226A320A|nr:MULTISPECIES: DNA-processing protein DprA [unclassified Gilliamella]MCX8656326.1 DNA-processing protein DprA [Gilliamella sp. B2894]MCX8693611.1 DNA-processing protein DprA [Gilliamella sp. B2881]MCX8696351.1 DNA-processing protein DprA [Gilliamella sp. B2828]MCX8700606.1 DNA-processing protein DprA [Gilliamella sp. B2840]